MPSSHPRPSTGLRVRRCRRDRIFLPRHPHHVVQRGRFGKSIFLTNNDYLTYLSSVSALRGRLGVKLYGYCLMPNHIHLLVDPGADAAILGLFMRQLASRDTLGVHPRKGRTRCSWDEFKCMPIESDRQLLACARYLDLNPVRAGMVERPEDYRWSSYRIRAGLSRDAWLDIDPAYLGLAATAEQCQYRYREFVEEAMPQRRLESLSALRHNRSSAASR